MDSDQPALFRRTSKAARPKAEDPYPGEARRLLALYVDLYRAKLHEDPNFDGHDAATLKRLITRFGPEKVETRLRFFMGWSHGFIEERGYTLRVFHLMWDQMTLVLHRQRAQGHRPPCPSDSRKMLDEMKTQGQSPSSIVPFRTTLKRSGAC